MITDGEEILAQEDFYFFTRFMFFQRRGFRWIKGRHHKIICDALQRVFNGTCTRLIINIPPRYSKTEIAIVNFIAWAFGKVPDCEFIHASYSSTLAVNNSANVLSLMSHEKYQEVFPNTKLENESKAHWRTTSGGVMYSTGTGGGCTGFGAGKHRDGFSGAILLDDPHKADEASSDVIRKGVIKWFQTTLESRCNYPGKTPIILIMQRLHEEDLSGWLLDGGNGEKWENIVIPAIQEDGTALWPEKHKIDVLRRMEKSAPYIFAGQYQQIPSPAEGGIFKPGMIEILPAAPQHQSPTRAWDLAATKNDGDWTAGAKLAKMKDGRTVILDIERAQGGPEEVESIMKNTATSDGFETRIRIPQDPGQAGKAQVSTLAKLLVGYSVVAQTVTGDKATRASGLAAQINVGNVCMVKASWNNSLVEEMRMFPNGKHDDMIDACSDAFNDIHGKPTGYFSA